MSKRKATKRKPATPAAPARATERSSVASPGLDLKLVRDLARIANEYDLQEIEVLADGSVRVARASSEVRTREPSAVSPLPLHPPIALVPPPPPSAPSPAPVADEDSVLISSPFVGTFYRAPSPESAPFVEVGQVIRKGQVVCIVEAMKLMNEIEAEADGKLVDILVKNGEHVEYGQPLFRLAKM